MDEGKGSNAGYVYVLTSSQTNLIKIGGTDYPPLKRIREINSTQPYKNLGPWTLADFRQVTDWRATEYALHYTFRSKSRRARRKAVLVTFSAGKVTRSAAGRVEAFLLLQRSPGG